ncbi:MAG TPA: hypothetical protein VNK96_07260 [Fimbriimonadales bacterium]|nr:hypothetical protein [Fimbriimonadales bacterium]
MSKHKHQQIGMFAFWGIVAGMVCTFILALIPHLRMQAVYVLLATPLLSAFLTALELILKGIYGPGISLLAAVSIIIFGFFGGKL